MAPVEDTADCQSRFIPPGSIGTVVILSSNAHAHQNYISIELLILFTFLDPADFLLYSLFTLKPLSYRSFTHPAVMIILYQTLLLAIPVLALHGVESESSDTSSLRFVFPNPEEEYAFNDGDKVVVEWRPQVELSEVYLNCTSSDLRASGMTSSMDHKILTMFKRLMYYSISSGV